MLTTRYRLLIAAAVLVLSSGAVLTATLRQQNAASTDPGSAATDRGQEIQIRRTYALNTRLRPNALTVTVLDRVVSLGGSVETAADKNLANQIANNAEGVRAVHDHILVASDPSRPYMRTAPLSAIDDAAITLAVQSRLRWSDYRHDLSAEVRTADGAVTLLGSAKSEAAVEFASDMAASTRGVRSVDNQLVIDTLVPAVLVRLWNRALALTPASATTASELDTSPADPEAVALDAHATRIESGVGASTPR